jgi:transcriptional regulator with XRE-family HTH domain
MTTAKESGNRRVNVSTPQLRAARAFLGWTAGEMERRSKVHRHTVRKIERGLIDKPQRGTLARIIGALERAGVEFLEDGGVRLKP